MKSLPIEAQKLAGLPERCSGAGPQDVTHLPSFNSLTGTSRRIKVVDIGANPIDGTPPYAALLRQGEADVVGFEPNPAALAKLQAARGPHETYLPHAVGDGEPHVLNLCASSGMTSLYEPNPAVLNLFHGFPQWGRVIERVPVETVRLDDVAETSGLELLKIDIQGGELTVFQHGRQRLSAALVIHTEVEFLPMYLGQPLFAEVDQFLRGEGFVLHRFFPITSRVIAPLVLDNNIYAGLSQLVWADAIFVKDFTRPDRFTDGQLLSTAKILHECYGSIDLALHLLLAHDRRRGTAFGDAYLAGLRQAPAAAPS
jgi:FkbM family methyltransferase